MQINPSTEGGRCSNTRWTGQKLGRMLAGGLLPLVILAGCASHSENNFTVGSVQSTYKTKHPIVIDEKEMTLEVPVAGSSYELTYPAQSSIEAFANRYKTGANGSLTVMIPAGSANEAAARKILPQIVVSLNRLGIPRNRIRSTTYYVSNYGSASPIRLSFTALAASVEECGKWPEDLAGVNGQNQNYHNFGCASQNNLAAQIANPADLMGPRAMTPIDAERRNEAIEAYRTGEVGTGSSITSVFE
ncbi:MAG: CpaD family pilus assembly protein [Rhizobiaceae bacterium]